MAERQPPPAPQGSVPGSILERAEEAVNASQSLGVGCALKGGWWSF